MSISALEEQNRNECQISCKLELVPGTHEFEGTMFSSSQTAYVFDDTLCQNKVHLIDSANLTGHDDTVFPIFEDGAISRDSEHFFWEYKNVFVTAEYLILIMFVLKSGQKNTLTLEYRNNLCIRTENLFKKQYA